jgi:hypothetical protein
MSTDVLSIYQHIAQAITDSIREEWQRAHMLIERQEGMIKFGNGKYTDETAYLKPFKVGDDAGDDIVFELNDLHALTTAGGNNRWNFLWFTVLPSGAYEIDFIWNQDKEDKLNHLVQTENFSQAARSAALLAFDQGQAERRSPLVYERLVREAAKLIPEEWTSAWVSLREAGIGIIEHHAAYQNPVEAAESAFTITYSLPVLLAVEELLQLKKESGHPDWKQVTFRFEAAGTYHATFATQPATEQAPAAGYTYEGRWLAPDAAAPFST